MCCSRVLKIGFEPARQVSAALEPKVKRGGSDSSVSVSLVAGPRAPAGEEAADLTGFPPLPSEDYPNAQATIPLKQQTSYCPPKPLRSTCSS